MKISLFLSIVNRKAQMQSFRTAIANVELANLGYNGSSMTCHNGQKDGMTIWERLVCAFGNLNFKSMFPFYSVCVVPTTTSDHVVLSIGFVASSLRYVKKKSRLFRFEPFWTHESSSREIVRSCW